MKSNFRKSFSFLTVSILIFQMTSLAASNNPLSAVSLESQPQILREDISKREEFIKYFEYDDGTYMASIYGEPVHYYENGKWIEIDNTLEEVNSSYLKNAANDFTVYIPKNSGTPAIMEFENKEIRFSLESTNIVEGESKELQSIQVSDQEEAMQIVDNQKSIFEYQSIEPNTNLEFEIHGKTFEQKIVLDQASSKDYVYDISFSGLTPEIQEDNSVLFSDTDTGTPLFSIVQPYIYDSSDNFCYDVSISIEQTETGCKYIVTPDFEWLTSSERNYPITIASVSTYVDTDQDATKIDDTTIQNGSPTSNFYLLDRMYVGSYVSGSNAYEHRAYVRLPLPSNLTGYQVASATFTLYLHSTTSWQSASNNRYDLYQANWSWDGSSLTWNTQPSQPLGRLIDYCYSNKSDTYNEWDITDLVKNWYLKSNNGLIIKPTTVDTAKTNRTCYYSSDCGTSIRTKRPFARIYYYPTLRVQNWGSVNARGHIAVLDNVQYSFYVPSTAQYTIVTAQPNAPHGVTKDTVLRLFDSNGFEVAYSDDASGRYSNITKTLSPGYYRAVLYNYPDDTTNLGCYTMIYKANELQGIPSTYSNLMYDFIKIGNASTTYNCLAYSIDNKTTWINPPGTLAATTAFMESRGYKKISSPTNNCIVAYGTESYVGHFAKVQNGVVTAKLGQLELMQHSSVDAYYSQSSYGSPIAYYSK